MNLAQLWRRRNFRKILNLIDRLPRDTHYRQAVSLDVEMAEAYMQSADYDPDETGDPRPNMSDFSPLIEQVIGLNNQIRMLRIEQIQTAGGGQPKIPMLEGPRTALQRVEGKARLRDHLTLSARLLPHKREEYLARAEEI